MVEEVLLARLMVEEVLVGLVASLMVEEVLVAR